MRKHTNTAGAALAKMLDFYNAAAKRGDRRRGVQLANERPTACYIPRIARITSLHLRTETRRQVLSFFNVASQFHRDAADSAPFSASG
jgi:hypothetical protein